MRVKDAGYGFAYMSYMLLWNTEAASPYTGGRFILVDKIGVRI